MPYSPIDTFCCYSKLWGYRQRPERTPSALLPADASACIYIYGRPLVLPQSLTILSPSADGIHATHVHHLCFALLHRCRVGSCCRSGCTSSGIRSHRVVAVPCHSISFRPWRRLRIHEFRRCAIYSDDICQRCAIPGRRRHRKLRHMDRPCILGSFLTSEPHIDWL